MGKNIAHDIIEYLSELVGFKSHQLIGRYGYSRSDLEDIQQDVTLHLLERMGQWNPERGSLNTFAGAVVIRKIASVIRHRSAARRDYRRVEPIDALAADDALAAPASSTDVMIDLDGALQKLDADSRQLCDSIMTSATRTGRFNPAARERIAAIRAVFVAAGLETYL